MILAGPSALPVEVRSSDWLGGAEDAVVAGRTALMAHCRLGIGEGNFGLQPRSAVEVTWQQRFSFCESPWFNCEFFGRQRATEAQRRQPRRAERQCDEKRPESAWLTGSEGKSSANSERLNFVEWPRPMARRSGH